MTFNGRLKGSGPKVHLLGRPWTQKRHKHHEPLLVAAIEHCHPKVDNKKVRSV